MTRRVLVVTDQHSRDHLTPANHPESVARIDAVERAVSATVGAETCASRLATIEELQLVHSEEHIARIRTTCENGGGWVDPDTYASPGTYTAARAAAAAGLVALERLDADDGLAAAFAVCRPPGHHAAAASASGFCFFNNVAIAAAKLVNQGKRVAVIDWDAHHGDGTQEIFWDEKRVLYVSVHQENIYPGTGYAHERGPTPGHLSTVNLPLPAGATGDHYLRLLETIVDPIVTRFEPDWILVSCGFDAHIDDPIAEMALRADDFALLAERVTAWAPSGGRTVLFLEGGYDLDAIEASTKAVLATLTDNRPVDPLPTTAGPGAIRVRELERLWAPS